MLEWLPDFDSGPLGEKRHLPLIGGLIVTQDVDAGIVALDLEVVVIGGQPPIENLRDDHTPMVQDERPGLFLTPVSSVAFGSDFQA